jgi:hypothetical protein
LFGLDTVHDRSLRRGHAQLHPRRT